MRRTRKLRLVLTFDTTDAALLTERTARAAGLDGRLIPVPREISAGCGLAWSAPPETGDALRQALRQAGAAVAGARELWL